MTASANWADLFDRGAAYDVDLERIRATNEALEDESAEDESAELEDDDD